MDALDTFTKLNELLNVVLGKRKPEGGLNIRFPGIAVRFAKSNPTLSGGFANASARIRIRLYRQSDFIIRQTGLCRPNACARELSL